jgi:hypothetical protein
MDPIIEQINGAREIRPHFLRVMREHLVTVVQPKLDAYDAAIAENLALKARVAELEGGQKRKAGAA